MRLRQVNCSKTSVLNKTQLLAEINVLRLLLTLVNFQSTEKVDSGGCVCVYVCLCLPFIVAFMEV